MKHFRFRFCPMKRVKRYLKFILPELFFVLLGMYTFCLPNQLFADPACTVLEDRDGNLLSARIAADGQWRFPYNSQVPYRFKLALIQFEDRDFYDHLGVSPKAVGRAVWQNSQSMKVRSGGSTLTMQLARMSRKNSDRGIWDKLIESIWATRIELNYSKEEILSLYASNAPFGGNVVGLDAASWRYFGRPADKLSWAESATLAVLPNAPSLIFPGKNQHRLLAKRNRLLTRLHTANFLDDTDLALALEEPLPQQPFPIPQLATQLLDRAIAEGHGATVIHSTVNGELQQQIQQVMMMHTMRQKSNDVHHMATLVLDLKTNEVISYVGNISDYSEGHGMGDVVDVIRAPRSSGSILKPLLYASALDEGLITPISLLPDIPTHLSGFSPKNFNHTYDGAVPAKDALARSLNIPMVRLLGDFGVEKFHQKLRRLGLSTINRPASHYGLALILGGAEVSLWDLCNAYARIARELRADERKQSNDPHVASYIQGKSNAKNTLTSGFSPASAWLMLDAMVEVNRPGEEAQWKDLGRGRKIAWKTGTSYGFRDAWSIGVTPRYVVGVWVGNASGEGRPGLTGISCAAPVLFDIFDKLPYDGWFTKPVDKMKTIPICAQSGFRLTEYCSDTVFLKLPESAMYSKACPYHQRIHLDAREPLRVNSSCADVGSMRHVNWFVLPPVMENYYAQHTPTYAPLPAWKPGCEPEPEQNIALVYPRKNSRISVPIGLEGIPTATIFEANHRRSDAVIYWHLDDEFIGSTRDIHQLQLQPMPGKHKLTLVDDQGNSISCGFEVLS